MKWLKSTTDKAYTAMGRTIPASTQKPLQVDNATYERLMQMAVIKSLVNTGGILVLDRFTDTSPAVGEQLRKLQTLSAENERLADRIRELESSTPAPTESSKVSAKKLKQAEDRALNAEHALQALQAKYAALEAEANAKIAELSKSEESE